MYTDADYVLILLLRALELETGSKQKAWEAVIKANCEQIEKAPDELKPYLLDKFEQLIKNRPAAQMR